MLRFVHVYETTTIMPPMSSNEFRGNLFARFHIDLEHGVRKVLGTYIAPSVNVDDCQSRSCLSRCSRRIEPHLSLKGLFYGRFHPYRLNRGIPCLDSTSPGLISGMWCPEVPSCCRCSHHQQASGRFWLGFFDQKHQARSCG